TVCHTGHGTTVCHTHLSLLCSKLCLGFIQLLVQPTHLCRHQNTATAAQGASPRHGHGEQYCLDTVPHTAVHGHSATHGSAWAQCHTQCMGTVPHTAVHGHSATHGSAWAQCRMAGAWPDPQCHSTKKKERKRIMPERPVWPPPHVAAGAISGQFT